MSTYKIETFIEALETAQLAAETNKLCRCGDDPHQNAMHDLAHDLPDLIGPVGMRADGSADPRVEAGRDALIRLGIGNQRAWDLSHAVVRAVFEGVTE